MKKAVLTALFVFGCGGPVEGEREVQGIASPVIACSQMVNGQCVAWTMTNPPAGFYDCAGDTTPRDGEFVIFSEYNYVSGGQQFCHYTHPANGTCTNDAGLGDYDGVRHIKSYKSRLHNFVHLWDGFNFWGTDTTTYGYGDVYYWPFSQWWASSLSACN